MDLHQAQIIVNNLFASQPFGVLATQQDGQPYVTLVAFAPTDDMQHLLFVTKRATTKFVHIKDNPHVAILIDNRSNHPHDFSQAVVVTVLGMVIEVSTDLKEDLLQHYLAKHLYLEDFARKPSSALMELAIEKFILVTRFQHVVEWEVHDSLDNPS